MKKAKILFMGIIYLLLTGCEPIEYLPIEKTSSVNFDAPSGIIEENNADGISIGLHLSVAARENGEIRIKQINIGEYNPLRTSPEISSAGIITLIVSKGSTEISFKVFPIEDQIIRGHQEIRFQIDAVSGSLIKGSNSLFELRFQDNELTKMI